MFLPWSEKKLVRRLKARDEQAFRRMVTLYQNKVYTLIFRMLGDAQEAEDLSQDVFITVFRAIDSFRGDAQFSTWLYRIAVNHAKNRIKYLARRRSKASQPIEDVDESRLQDPSGSRIPAPDKVLLGQELEGVLQRAIAELDEEHRSLLVLREIENLSYAEIEAITGLPSGTVKSRLHRARLQLKDVVERYMNPDLSAQNPDKQGPAKGS
ncbi:MAG: sigma-70 family RNA polymerase sigma factor [Myxococcota bacterium]|jgi:RNA polymerase sigma-70 factor (ECF subfamily)|nr:sigma-70 family RNA polymerase sigma factor [Myxococcota bacterium]